MEKSIKFFIGAEDQDGKVLSKHYVTVQWKENIEKEFKEAHGHSKSFISEVFQIVLKAIKDNLAVIVTQIITDILARKTDEK